MIAIEPAEWSAIWLSLKVAAAAAAVVLPAAVFLGWLLARRNFRGKLIVESLIHAPLVMPPVVTGYLLLITFGGKGVIGKYLLQWFGLQFIFNWKGAVLASAFVALPLAVRSVRLAVALVDQRLEEAALILGYSPLRVFACITLPLAWPGVLAGTLLAFTRSLGEFGATITFAGNIEGVTQTIPLALYSSLQVPGSEAKTIRYVICSLALCFSALILSELLTRLSQKRIHHAT